MFGLFKKKSEIEKLQKRYSQLMADAHRLSTIDRKQSDQKYYEADQVLKQMDALPKS